MHKWLPILLNAFDSVLLNYRTVKRLLIPILQIRVRKGKLFLLFLNQNICCGYLNGTIKRDGSFEDQKHTLELIDKGNITISMLWKIAEHDLCGIKNAFFREMQFWLQCYTVVSYQALFRLSVFKFSAVYLSGAKNVCFCTIGDFGSLTIISQPKHTLWVLKRTVAMRRFF